jgi:hypothetical protein
MYDFTRRALLGASAATLMPLSISGLRAQSRTTLTIGYPLVAAIVPNGSSDPKSALAGRALWGMINCLHVAELWTRRLPSGSPLDAEWEGLRQLLPSLQDRLGRVVEGGHFFFVGSRGAQATANAISALAYEIAALSRELDSYCTSR